MAVVNVAGSFAIGVLYVLLSSRTALAPALMTGLLGGFTHLFGLLAGYAEAVGSRPPAQAALYVATSVLLSLAAVAAGVSLARAFA